ncbi:MAG: hypothetical protein RSB99_01785 [Bacilli bacterium]
MKRIFSLTVLIALLIFVSQFGVVFFHKEHLINYDLKTATKDYKIEEHFLYSEGKPIYQFTVKYDNSIVLLENRTNYNKQKKLITDIISFEKDGFICFYPIYHNNIKDTHDIECVKEDRQYSYTYLKNGYPSLQEFELILQKKDILLPSSILDKSPVVTDKGISIYQKNIPNNFYLTVWQYNSIQIMSNDHITATNLLANDQYNNRGIAAGKYYIIPEFTSMAEFNRILIADIFNFGSKPLDIGTNISNDCYFNGVVDGKVYLFDRNNKRQFEISPKDRTVREIGNVNINAQFYDGYKWSERNIYDFISNKIYFTKDFSKIKELDKYPYTKVVETENSYYFSTRNKEIYRLWKTQMDRPVLLLSNNQLKEFSVYKDYVFYLAGDTLYIYQENFGLKPLVINNEFRFNQNNMYSVYEK